MRDADHSLAFMDFVRAHSSDEQWILSHEQYRPYVLFHRTQAAVLAKLEEVGAEAAITELNLGLGRFRDLFAEYEAEEQFEDDEMVQRLVELKEALRNQYHLKATLEERLAEAVATEQYELAARLRDEMSRKQRPRAHRSGRLLSPPPRLCWHRLSPQPWVCCHAPRARSPALLALADQSTLAIAQCRGVGRTGRL